MALDSMRVGGGRCPPIVVGLLFLLCFLLTCNWWNISTENAELLQQIDQLHEEIRISLEERQKCETITDKCDARFKQCEEMIATGHIRENELRKNNDELTKSVELCNSEIDSMKTVDATKNAALDALRLDKDTVTEQLNLKREESQKLQADLEKIKIELSNLNRTCSSKAAQAVQEQEQNNSKDLGNFELGDDNDTAGEIDDGQQLPEPSGHRSPSPDNRDPVFKLVARGSNAVTFKPK